MEFIKTFGTPSHNQEWGFTETTNESLAKTRSTKTLTRAEQSIQGDIRIIGEDLSVSSNSDWDFNDIVLDIKLGPNAIGILQAAGGTLPLRIRHGSFNKEIHEYNLNILDEEKLDINYELSNDSSKVNISGNGNFNETKNVIKIILDDKEEYTINVFKSEPVSKVEKVNTEVKPMSYIKKEIVKFIIITISCTLIFLFYRLIFISKFTLNVLPNTLHK